MKVLGFWDGHDAGAALLVDGRCVAAVNEERLSRRKLEACFPARSIRMCLELGEIEASAIDAVATCTTDVAKALARVFPSTREAYYQLRRRKTAPGALAGLRIRAKYGVTQWPPNVLSRLACRRALQGALAAVGLRERPLVLFDHHECHAATAAYASGFEAGLVVTIDGLGDGTAATVSRYRDGRLTRLATTPARHSPGVFFEHVTRLLNMRELEDEGKVMALADHAARVPDADNPMLSLLWAEGQEFRCARPGIGLIGPLRRILWRFPNEQFAFMAQRALEEACVGVVTAALAATGERHVALAGGVASNVKVNRRLRHLPGVEDVFVFPHMGDGGLALGAAALASLQLGKVPDLRMPDLGVGPDYSDDVIREALGRRGLSLERCSHLPEAVADLIAAGRVVLWFEGGMEYGPRALGHRSLLARPDRPALRDRLNLVLKRRVWYQPFCPAILESSARCLLADFTGSPNRHMTMAYQVATNHLDALSGAMNVDGSCRPQIVADDDPGPFAALLRHVEKRIGVGAVLNTSFNVHGSPLVCTPDEAIDVFLETGADALAIGPFLLRARGTQGADA